MWAVVTLNYSSTVLDFTNNSSDMSRSLIPKAVIFLCSMIILFSPYVLPLCSVVAFVFGRIIPKEIQSSIIRIQNFTPKEYFRLYSSREFQVTINCLKKGNHRQFFTLYNLQKITMVCYWSNYEFSHIVMQIKSPRVVIMIFWKQNSRAHNRQEKIQIKTNDCFYTFLKILWDFDYENALSFQKSFPFSQELISTLPSE